MRGITLDVYGAPRVSGGMCLGLYDLLLIGEMVRNRGHANGREVVPASWIDDIFAVRDNHVGGAKISLKAPVFSLMATTDHYGTNWFKDQEICHRHSWSLRGSTSKTVGDCEMVADHEVDSTLIG